MINTKILIDCDPGHDDAVAILFAARHLNLVGVTSVYGNNTVENTTRNALAIIELAGIDVPLAMGCGEPLAQRRVGAAAVHVPTPNALVATNAKSRALIGRVIETLLTYD